MKTFNANIRCATCDAQPYPDDPSTTRESFDLVRVGDAWFCEKHRPPKEKRAPRPVAATPTEALTAFETLVATEGSRLEEALRLEEDETVEPLAAFRQEIARGVASLRKAVQP